MKNLAGLQCPSCSRFIYDWSQHIECLFNSVTKLKEEVAQLQLRNRRLMGVLNEEETEG